MIRVVVINVARGVHIEQLGVPVRIAERDKLMAKSSLVYLAYPIWAKRPKKQNPLLSEETLRSKILIVLADSVRVRDSPRPRDCHARLQIDDWAKSIRVIRVVVINVARGAHTEQ